MSPRRISLPTVHADTGASSADSATADLATADPAAAVSATNKSADSAADPAADPAVVQTVWARVFMDSLRKAGLSSLIVSPGSRSTPLVLAAEFCGLPCHNVIDERAAAFYALGRAKASNRAVGLLCTSGSAAAHYFPAIIEAAQAYVPLVVLTADRPPELQQCAAPQTIDQNRLYGGYVRHFADLGPADGGRASLQAVARKAAQAVALARAPTPGPVHVNVPARKPLEPRAARSPADLAVLERGDDVRSRANAHVASGVPRADDGTIAALAQACVAAERGIIAFGPAPQPGPGWRSAAMALARATGYPLLAESASQLRFGMPLAVPGTAPGGVPGTATRGVPGTATRGVPGTNTSDICLCDAFDGFLANSRFRDTHSPELILQIGAPPTSKAWADFVTAHRDAVHCVIAAWGWNDPHSSADMFITADPTDTMIRLADAINASRSASPSASLSTSGSTSLSTSGSTSGWTRRFAAANHITRQTIAAVLHSAASNEAGPASTDGVRLREARAVRAAVDALPTGSLLSLGNSLPIRTVDMYCPGDSRDIAVLSQRGANGIDGLIAAAAGAASNGQRPTLLILGDVSFAHDIGALATAPRSRGQAPLVIVVIDNRGGRIFEQLPIAGRAGDLLDTHWITPPAIDIAAAAAVYGHTYTRANNAQTISDAVGQALRGPPRCSIIHVPVVADSARQDLARVHAALDHHLAEVGSQIEGHDPMASTR